MLQLLPFELIILVIKDLTIHDIYNLSLTCKDLRILVQEETTCRRLLEACFHANEEEAMHADRFQSRRGRTSRSKLSMRGRAAARSPGTFGGC